MRRNPRRTDSSLVFAAVKRMAPSSLEAIGPHVPNKCFFQRGVGFDSGMRPISPMDGVTCAVLE